MLPNYAPLGWPRSLLKGSSLDLFFLVKMGEKPTNVLKGIDTLPYQCIGGKWWNAT